MKIHYNEEFNCFETTECHKTDNIELDGVKLIPITELEKIKAEIEEIRTKEPLISRGFECYGFKDKTAEDIKTEVIELLENHISKLKGEQK